MTNRALAARLEQGDTGRLRVGRGSSALHVCVWNGEIVAATSEDDLRHILRRLLISGELDADRVQHLIAMEDSGEAVFGTLCDEVDPEVMETVLLDRFTENLTRFLGSAARPRFSHVPAIFADNFQLGHDAAALMQSSADAWDDAMSVDPEMDVFPGSAPPRTELQRIVLARVGNGCTLSNLLVQLPAEPFSARALVARMLRSRMVDTTLPAEADTQHSSNGRAHPAVVQSGEGVALNDLSGESYVPDDDTPISVSTVLPDDFEDAVPAEVPFEEDIEDPPTEPGAMLGSLDDPPTEEVARAFDASELAQPSQGELAAATNKGAGDLSSLDAWMNHGVEVEDDLEVFEDFEGGRGDEQAGSFTTEEHNLDRVEVVRDLDEVVEMPEAPTARFGAPVLSEEDARAKLSVANSVLATVADALDHAEGTGRGQAALQILLEGSPSEYQPLFANLVATDEGTVPGAGLLRNLNHRPPTEHRRLLNQGLLNLIERCLSIAVEELPDEAIDEVLESVVGYRQRLGL